MKSAVLALLITPFILLMSLHSALAQESGLRPRLISVTGTAELSVAPDQVIITVGVQTRDRDLSIAKSQHDGRAKKVIAHARNAGIDPKYIQTSSIQMSPEYSEERVPRFLAYAVSQTIQITLKDISKYEPLLSHLIEGGVNRIDGVEFQVADSRKYQR